MAKTPRISLIWNEALRKWQPRDGSNSRGAEHPDREWQRLRGCESKVGYETAAFAQQAMGRARGGRKLMIYRCDFCEKFHLASKREYGPV